MDVHELVTQCDGPSGAIHGDRPGPAVTALDAGDQVVVPVVDDEVAGVSVPRRGLSSLPGSPFEVWMSGGWD